MFKTKEIVKQFLEKHYSKDYYFTTEGECSKCDVFDISFVDDNNNEQKDGGVFEFQRNFDGCIQFSYKNRTIKIFPFLCDKSDNFVYRSNISRFTMVIKQKDESIEDNEWNINNYDFYLIPNKILQTWFNEYKKSHGKKDLISCWFRLKSLINNQKYKNNFEPLDKYIASIDKKKINTEIEEKINQQIKRGI